VPAFPTLQLGWVLIGGFFTAGIVSVGTAYGVDRLDASFRTPDELNRYLELKVLASIPTGDGRK
jgi:capsular polysaccharide biosynthesis protein